MDSISPAVEARQSATLNADQWPEQYARGYKLLEQPYGTMRPMRVVFVGAGASGICFAKFADNQLTDTTVQINDGNDDVGGTWLENRYPGCKCDIPSVSYQFSWARNPRWSQYYSGAREIWNYLCDIVDKYQLRKYIKLKHTVISANWNEDEGKWHVLVKDGDGAL